MDRWDEKEPPNLQKLSTKREQSPVARQVRTELFMQKKKKKKKKKKKEAIVTVLSHE
jgi:hypothetical protein